MALTTVQDEHPAHTFDEPPMLIERHAAYFEAIGTARQLTQAAICVPTQIPHGRRRTAFERLPDGRFMTMRKQPGNRWRVTVTWTDAQRQAVREADERKRAAANMPQTVEQWRQSQAGAAKLLTTLLVDMAQDSKGYGLTPRATRQIHAMAMRINMVYQHAPVIATRRQEQSEGGCDATGPMPNVGPHLRLVRA